MAAARAGPERGPERGQEAPRLGVSSAPCRARGWREDDVDRGCLGGTRAKSCHQSRLLKDTEDKRLGEGIRAKLRRDGSIAIAQERSRASPLKASLAQDPSVAPTHP